MEDLCTLAQIHPDDLSTHAVSLALLARALNDAHEAGGNLDRAAFHRAADLALALFAQEKKRFESVDCSAPLLDTVYLRAFLAVEPMEESMEDASRAIGRRFRGEILRLLYARPAAVEEVAVGC